MGSIAARISDAPEQRVSQYRGIGTDSAIVRAG